MWAEHEITRGEWLKARAPIEKRLEAAKKKLAALNRTTVLLPFVEDATALRQQWQTMTLSRQHQIIIVALQHVEVRPAVRGRNRFDESRLRPVWRV
jgi:site-specific DNA recombinase